MSKHPSRMTRKTFIKRVLAAGGALAIGAGNWACKRNEYESIAGGFVDPSFELGHLLRDAAFAKPVKTEFAPVAIIGGGIAGLSAGWHLLENGIEDFRLLELEDHTGGNSAWGENHLTAYPWGAHYLPIPGKEHPEIIDLLLKTGAIEKMGPDSLPIYREEYLCASPHEKLNIHGVWQEGLIPRVGVPPTDREQIADFFRFMEEMRQAQGQDGKPAFAIPVSRSSRDPEFLALDQMDMAAFMQQKGWNSPYIRWYVDYCCRDDYGSSLAQTSAWAGIAYFASRRGEGYYAKSYDVLTWANGNGWLVEKMTGRLGGRVQTKTLATHIALEDDGVVINWMNTETRQLHSLKCTTAILATPQFVNQYIFPGDRNRNLKGFRYAPWVTANITLEKLPANMATHLAWDNVRFESPSLGYVHARHQEFRAVPPNNTVLTWYYVLSNADTRAERKQLLEAKWAYWRDFIVQDLEATQKGISGFVRKVDVWRWGHGMIKPVTGFIWGGERERAGTSVGRVHFAHSDLSGISIFEEAFYQGRNAAKMAIRDLSS